MLPTLLITRMQTYNCRKILGIKKAHSVLIWLIKKRQAKRRWRLQAVLPQEAHSYL
jgi:ribosomal protein L34